MIKSFLPSATVFTSNGERIIQAIKCIEHRELGDWYVDLVASLEYQSYLEKDYILVVPTKEKGDQPFRINNPKITDKVDVRAYHIGFDTRNYAVELSTILNGNAQACLDELDGNIDGTHPFTFTSSITTLKSFSVVDSSLYNALIQIAEEYNGILDFNGWNVTITSSIGSDNGVILAYGKNIQESEINENWDLVVTKLKPIGNNGITLTPKWLTADVSYDRPYTKIMNFDSSDLSNLALVAQLYLDRYKVPRVNYKVKADVEQNVALGDSVTVNARQFTTTAEVLSFDYNPLINRVIQVEFGNFRPTLKQFFSDQAQAIEEKAVKKAYVRIEEEIGDVEVWAQNQIELSVGDKEDVFYRQDTEPFTNLVDNGTFINTTDWAGINAGLTANDGVLEVLAIATGGYARTIPGTVIGNKYYIFAQLKSDTSSARISFDTSQINHTGDNAYQNLSFIHTATSTTHEMRIIDNRSSAWTKLYLKKPIIIDLTVAYGSGNEPSKAQMDSFINRIWLDTSNGTYKSFGGGGWNPASELKGSKFVLDNEGGKFYGDGFKLYDNSAVLKVFFDLVKDAFNLGINANLPVYEPTTGSELISISTYGRKGIQFGEPDLSGNYKAFITAVNLKTILGGSDDVLRMVIKSFEDLRLVGEDELSLASNNIISVNRGIQFPTTKVLSTNLNTLDDYEEGTWTPVLFGATSAGTGTYSAQVGTFTKIGNVVHFDIYLVWSAHTGTGQMKITLPYTSGAGVEYVCNVFPASLTFSNQLAGVILSGDDDISLFTFASNAARSALNMDTSATLSISGTYRV